MIDEKEAFIQHIENVSEIAGEVERLSRRLFREVQKMCDEYKTRWPSKQPQPDQKD